MGIENGIEYEHTDALLRTEELSPEDQGLLRVILRGKTITKDRTSHALISVDAARGEPLTPGQIRKARRCDACMEERRIDVDETALHVAKVCHRSNDSETQHSRRAPLKLEKNAHYAFCVQA